MTQPAEIQFHETDLDAVKTATGCIAVFADPDGKLDPGGRRVDSLTKKAVSRLLASPAWDALKPGESATIAWPHGLAAEAVLVVKLASSPSVDEARRAGAAIAAKRGTGPLLVLAGSRARTEDMTLGLALRGYDFADHRTGESPVPGPVRVMAAKPEALAAASGALAAVAEGVFFTRDLVNEPANVLTTDDFAARLAAMQDLGLDIEILEEADLETLGMRLLLGVGQGSASPSKVVVMQWNGGGDAAPLALVGKGVVFDTGGISLKPGPGMEEMTMDMGGAGTVAGVMRALALRKARANVVGLVGLVENMPSGTAIRPGDVIRSMKGDTVEIHNTDAEGRLVLADVLWYAQERFAPAGIVDLATLTGAMVVALGHETAGVFSNDDALCGALLDAAGAEGEAAWRLPMGPAYDALLKSRIADMKNIGGRPAGAISAAQFLRRFVKEDVPWCHIDIAGVASSGSDRDLSPKGATGWGVLALNRLVADRFEG